MRAVLMILGLSLASPALSGLTAQEFDLVQSTRTEFGGSLGFIMRLMGTSGVQTQRLMVSGGLSTIRTDDVEDGTATTSNIVEYATGAISVIDHDEKSYYTFNIGDAFARGPLQVGTQPESTDVQAPEPENDGAEYDVSIKVDSPGGSKALLGYTAEPMWVTITATPRKAPEGMSLDSMPSFVMLTEMWVSEDFPGNTAMAEISEQAAAQLSESSGLDGEVMARAFSQNPHFAEAFEQNQEELERLRNLPLEQLSVFVALSPGAEMNADSALHGPMGEMKIDIVGAVASGASDAIAGAIGRRLGGFGRRSEPEPPPPPPQATQTLMFRVHELAESFNSGPLESGWNLVPAAYERRESPFQTPPPQGP